MTNDESDRLLVSIEGVDPGSVDQPQRAALADLVHSFASEHGMSPDWVEVLASTGEVDADAVQDRLPDGWVAENDGPGDVYVYPETGGVPEPPREAPASFGISHDEGDMFVATKSVSSDRRGGYHDLESKVHGLRERCIEWVVERAEEAG